MRTPHSSVLLAFLGMAALANACSAVVLPSKSSDEGDEEPEAKNPRDAAAGSRRDAQPAPDTEVWAPPVACGEDLPGPPMASVVEAEPGFAEELAAVDTDGVADPIDYGSESKLVRGVINYMLGRASGTTAARAEALDAGVFGRVILASAAREDGGIDVVFLRRGLHHAYLCSRPLPADLDEVRRRYGDYRSWPSSTVACSRPKGGPRRLFQDSKQGVYVAETLVDGGVRETEILWNTLRDDGQLDFAVYTADGELTNRSTFATASSEVTSSAPYTCMTCHLDPDAGTLTRLFPTGTGAGCK